MKEIPKVVWIYWHQGEANAPEIITRCIESWRVLNPAWTVNVLDRTNFQEPTHLEDKWAERSDLSLQMLADIIRTALLARQGGLWADATVFCTTPLDSWLPEMMQSGYFSASGIRGGRIIENSFMASEKGNIIPVRLLDALLDLFKDRRFTGNETNWGLNLRSALKPVLGISPSTTRIWFSPLFTDYLRLYPYFTWHYMFNKLFMDDVEFAKAWTDTQTLPGWPLIRVKRSRNRPVTPELRQFILSEEVPAHKLNWQADLDTPYWKEVFELFKVVQQVHLKA